MAAAPLAHDSDPIQDTPREPLFNCEAVGAATLVFALSRLPLVLVTSAVALIHGSAPWNVWNRWDTVWYLGIADHGYHWINQGHYASQFSTSTLAFFPALPGLLRLGEAGGLDGVVAGLVVANVAFFCALIYLHALLRGAWEREVASRARLILAFFPTAFFFAAPYTEALCLLAAAAVLYHAERDQTLRAGVWLALGLLTRSTAVVVILPALMLLPDRRASKLMALFTPSAAAWMAYAAYLRAQGIGLTALVGAQHAWHRGLALPTTGFTSTISWLSRNAVIHWPIAIESAGDLIATTLFLVLTARAWPELSRPMKAYCAGFWLLVLCTPEWLDGYAAPFSSMDRFVLMLFPLAGWVARKLKHRRPQTMTIVSGTLMAALAGIHLSGGWVG